MQLEDIDKVYPADLKILVLLGECGNDGRLYSGSASLRSVFQLLYCLPVSLMKRIP